ncbi:FecCD family ABC transporter permease [Glutamicibacter nicotianae]|uniref:FecCD family ABC transporter permease n=1 Tax=Glutamicibacter nicotianae TaxID=37929 RepID=UPI001CC03268|nr:iron ABC transporter permease [Glutamicibacter nicotianae]
MREMNSSTIPAAPVNILRHNRSQPPFAPAAHLAARERPPTINRTTPRISSLLVLAAAVGAAIGLSLWIGSTTSSFAELRHALLAPDGQVSDIAIREIRWPRTVTALAAGAALGMAGTLIQGHTRNPIAEPGLLGINQGAALAIVSVAAFTGPQPAWTQALLALGGALLAALVVFGIGRIDGRGGSPITLLLVGAAVTSLCAGVISAIVLLSEAALETLRFWQVGSVVQGYESFLSLWPLLIAGTVLALANARGLNALTLGEDSARSLGITALHARGLGLAAIVALSGLAVTLAGPIAFLGLLVPHIARRIFGADYRWVIPGSALCGALMLCVADVLGRMLARPGELPVGVVIALLGAPFFIYVARRRKAVAV